MAERAFLAACGQMPATTLAEAEAAWPRMERLVAAAAERGARLLVLPETAYPAYWLGSKAAYRAAGVMSTGDVIGRLAGLARGAGLWLVAGIVEEAGAGLFNSAALIDPAGRTVGIARKNFLWDCDNRWFSPGDHISTFDTDLGRMGVLICADGRAPEISATLAACGAEFMVLPTAWVNAAKGTGRFRNPQAEFLIRARAREFCVPYVCASKSGREGDVLEYVGQSQIVDARGEVTAIAPIEGEHLVVGEVRPRRARAARVDEATRAVLLRPGIRSRPSGRGPAVMLHAGKDGAAVMRAIFAVGGRATRLDAAEMETFVAARAAALQGAQVVVVDRAVEELWARARAAENRVYVMVVSDEGLDGVMGLNGDWVWRRGAEGDSVGVELGLADDKRVTPETDVWEQRRVGAYGL